MSVDVKSVSYSGNGFTNKSVTVSYSASNGTLATAGGALSYFYASFGNKTDHHVKTLEAFVSTVLVNSAENDVTADLTGEMEDGSGNQATVTVTAVFPAQHN